MNNKRIIILLSTIGLLVFGGVTSLAYVNYQATKKAQVTTGTLDVSLSQNTMAVEKFEKPVMPLDTVDKQLFISTSGTYNQYLRVQCYRYWTNQVEDFEVAPDADGSLIEFALHNPNDWIVITNDTNKDLFTLYYKHPVAPNTKLQVLDHIVIGNIPSSQQASYSQYGIQVDTKADAIQCLENQPDVNKKAMSDVWDVNVSIDEKGKILSIES